MIFIGLDPGASGAIACFIEDDIEVIKLTETEHDVAEWLHLHAGVGKSFALIEKVHAMPKQGVTSMFKFGQSYGFLRGLLRAYAIPFEEVTPQKWQKAMGCLSKGDKNVTKSRAQALFPKLKITHATADALLIAEYCRRTHANP
jgi:crossover junction endodeoxyribonuclease RuvC